MCPLLYIASERPLFFETDMIARKETGVWADGQQCSADFFEIPPWWSSFPDNTLPSLPTLWAERAQIET